MSNLDKYSFLQTERWQQFIQENKSKSIETVLFSLDKNTIIDKVILAQQIVGHKVASKKVESWSKHAHQLIFPPKINLEQSSSELTAKYKASLFSGQSFIDITGGFGVDSFFFGTSFKHGIHCEINIELQCIVSHNFDRLQTNIKSIQTDGLDYLRSTIEEFDMIYVDPSRRDQQNRKVVRLQDYSPNVLDHMDLLLSKGREILLKTSPLLDIKQVISLIPNLQQVHVVAVDNECKELLFLIKRHQTQPISIYCQDLTKHIDFRFTFDQESKACQLSPPQNYLYEPNVTLLKAGAFNSIAHAYNVNKLHPNTHLYTSNLIVPNFPGKVFEIIEVVKLDKSAIFNVVKDKKANLTKRNFPLSVSEIRKKVGLKEGGDWHLFATTLMKNSPKVLICKKVT